jgi:hypothetical protein
MLSSRRANDGFSQPDRDDRTSAKILVCYTEMIKDS